MEIWKDIPGYEGVYQVSSLGRVKSCARLIADTTGRVRRWAERILVATPGSHGYPMVHLMSGNRPDRRTVHRLVAEAFLPAPSMPDMQVNHKDGSRSNNSAQNLEWVTRRGNLQHAAAMGRLAHPRAKGAENGNARWTEAEVMRVRSMYPSKSMKAIAAETGIPFTTVRRMVRRITWGHVE